MEKIPTKEEIMETRKEIEKYLEDLLIQTESDFCLEDIKDVIYNEEDQDDLMDVIAMFDRGGDASELSNILDATNDAWNYFPHKCLNGLCPMEMILKHHQEEKDKKR